MPAGTVERLRYSSHPFETSELYRGGLASSTPRPLYPRKKPGTHRTEDTAQIQKTNKQTNKHKQKKTILREKIYKVVVVVVVVTIITIIIIIIIIIILKLTPT
jgi:hypothetical protein